MRSFILLFVYFLLSPLFADVSIRLKGGKNYGEFLEQTGGGGGLLYGVSDPTVKGGGSRITYPNQFSYLGIGVLFEWNKLRFESELDSTLGYAYTGIGKNED